MDDEIRLFKDNPQEEYIFKMILEESCRQWCDMIDECPERKTGEGFANFVCEVYKEKKQEYIEELESGMTISGM